MNQNIAIRQSALFFAVTIGLSFFVFWGPLALFQVPAISFVSSTKGPVWAIVLFILGGFVPSLVGLLLTAVWEGRTGLRQMGRRVIQFQIGWRWYLTALGVIGFASLIQVITGSLLGSPFNLSLIIQQLSSFLSLIILGPLSEELGWRGFAQERLQKAFDPLIAGVVVGILWALWHFPLFYLPGTAQHELNLPFLPFMLTLVGLSVIFAWLHYQTSGSIWMAIFFHWIYTCANQVISSGLWQNSIYSWLACTPYLIVAGLIFAFWKTRNQAIGMKPVQSPA